MATTRQQPSAMAPSAPVEAVRVRWDLAHYVAFLLALVGGICAGILTSSISRDLLTPEALAWVGLIASICVAVQARLPALGDYVMPPPQALAPPHGGRPPEEGSREDGP
jgi:hypothetical protein